MRLALARGLGLSEALTTIGADELEWWHAFEGQFGPVDGTRLDVLNAINTFGTVSCWTRDADYQDFLPQWGGRKEIPPEVQAEIMRVNVEMHNKRVIAK
jgi:hypothetical protein